MVIERAGMIVMLKAFEAVSAGVLESVAVTVKLAVPAVVGVPEITPVAPARAKPVGSEPAVTDQVMGAAPPVDVKAAL